MQYSDERREAILKKLLPPHNRTVAEVAQEEGISAATLYNWRKKARQVGRLLPDQSDDPEGWSSQDKFHAVLETAALSEAERAEYCRQRGLYPEQIQRWRRVRGCRDMALLVHGAMQVRDTPEALVEVVNAFQAAIDDPQRFHGASHIALRQVLPELDLETAIPGLFIAPKSGFVHPGKGPKQPPWPNELIRVPIWILRPHNRNRR
ncbi:transposase [Halomonas cerina]|uniref:Transposase-like protein n=1 Tax=Halomonas cerina TaxID=447424 RepID=A0A839VE75_9GAMM|nr:transposase [Halomonas cerina]MBB3192428.1 transposase-like protein [Halomonas cerina]